MSKLAWIHVSDWHQRGDDFDRTKVRDALLTDLAERDTIDPDLREIGFMVFSGDIAFSGQKSQYEVARRDLILPALDILGIGPDRLILVPGNHDVDRGALAWQRSDLLEEFKTRDAVALALRSEQALRYLADPFTAYSHFASSLIADAGERPEFGYRRVLRCGDIDVLVVALNTALVSGRASDAQGEVHDEGALFVGEPMVYHLLSDPPPASMRIAVMHHPFHWLVDFERHHLRRKVLDFADFVLHGHEHTPNVEVLRDTGG